MLKVIFYLKIPLDLMNLFFQKPSLLRLVFEVYGRAPKMVNQVS